MPAQELKNPQETISEALIPPIIYGVTLTPSQITRASLGEPVLLENMQLPDKRLVDGKVSFFKENGEVKMKLLEKKHNLEIPDKVLDYTLSKKEKEDLLNEKVVPIKFKDQQLYVQIDKDLNRVVVKTDREFAIPQEIGGYKLSDSDKALFANNQPLPPRVYFNEKTNTYFLATVKRTDDNKGLEFSNYKEIPHSQAQEFKSKYNVNQQIQNITDITTKIETVNKTEIQKKVEKSDKMELFVEFTRDRNFEGLEELNKKGFKVSAEMVDKTTKSFNYTQEEKTQLQNSVSIQKTKPVSRHNSHEISI